MADATTKNEVTPETLRKLLEYRADTGLFFWRERGPEWFTSTAYRTAQGCANNWNARHAGNPAFSYIGSHGYYCGRVFQQMFLAHRVAFAIQEGVWPPHFIDHVNGCRTDNRWSNLRPCTRTENNRNSRGYGGSGYIGVYKNTNSSGYSARVYADGVTYYCGSGPDPQELAVIRDKKALDVHGKYASLNFPELFHD